MNIQILKSGRRLNSFLALTSLALPLLMSSGCMLTDMQDKTDHIADTSDKISSTSDKLNTTSQSLNDLTLALYTDLRQGNSTDLRRKFLDQIDNDSSQQAKISDATVYCMSMEFQLVKDLPMDNTANQLNLYHEAMQQFMFDLTRYIPDPKAAIDPSSTSTRDEGMFAFSLAISQINMNEQERKMFAHEPQITVQDLIENALSEAKDIDTGKIPLDQVDAYKQDILLSQDLAVHLLQTRVNFVPALMLNFVTDIGEQGLIGKGLDLIFGLKMSFDNVNLPQMAQLTSYMQDANHTIAFLNKNGFSPNVNGNLVKLLSKLEMPAAGSGVTESKYSPADRAARVTAESALLNELHTYRKQVGAE